MQVSWAGCNQKVSCCTALQLRSGLHYMRFCLAGSLSGPVMRPHACEPRQVMLISERIGVCRLATCSAAGAGH